MPIPHSPFPIPHYVLYLSKLLPLFFYPLGLACVSLVVALVTLWKRPRTAAIAIAFALTLLRFCSNAWIANIISAIEQWQKLHVAQIPVAEAIVVLVCVPNQLFPQDLPSI